MANTKISALTANTNPTGNEELVYAYNNANGKMTLNTMKTFASADSQPALVSGVNIKTINGDSILWSWNLVVSWWGGGGWFEPTELGWDANIWELSEWAYVTTHNLYYMSGQAVPTSWTSSVSKKQMLFVTENSEWWKWYFVFNINTRSNIQLYLSYAAYGYSISSTAWECNQLWKRDYLYAAASEQSGGGIDLIHETYITQFVPNIEWGSTQELRISSVYKWLTYTIYISSVASPYDITLWQWVTNPFNISLPSNSSKWCIITVLATSENTWIVTSCQMLP